MMNFNVATDDSFIFFRAVLDKKYTTRADPGYKDRVRTLYPDIEPLHTDYDTQYEANNLQGLTAFGYVDQDKDDLQKLYKYDSTIIYNLKQSVITTPSNRIINTCQNCTISSVDSMDHILPQGRFPEFIVHPKNLFPSCSECNRIKNDAFDQGAPKRFLNLYLDILPTAQYLFVTIENGVAGLYPRFNLANPNGIDENLYQLILSHYTKLDLPQKFSLNSDSVVTTLVNNIRPSFPGQTRDEIVTKSKETARLNQISFGWNYWKSVLEISLLDSNLFWALI